MSVNKYSETNGIFMMTEQIQEYTPANGTDGDIFEKQHCYNCASYVLNHDLRDYDCNKSLLTKAWFFDDTRHWFEIWEDGKPIRTGCREFKDKSVRSVRAKKAHITMKENYHNDPRQLKLNL